MRLAPQARPARCSSARQCRAQHQGASQAAAERVEEEAAHYDAQAALLAQQAGQLRAAQQAWDARLADEQAAASQVHRSHACPHQSARLSTDEGMLFTRTSACRMSSALGTLTRG